MKSNEQVDSDTVEANAISSPTSSRPIVSELSREASVKLEVILSLIEPCDRTTYGERLREGAKKLGVSVRSVQRLFKKYQEEGLAALTSTTRGDKGKHRISEFWQDFIVKTYQQGNKGSKRMTPKQVALKVQVKASDIGDKQPPTYRTVLRVLKPLQEKEAKAKSIRTPGWRGSTLSVKTRDGDDLEISYSNQVWQCDHTRADVLLVDQSRYQRWEAGLRGEPELMSERDLDICLMKVARRTVQRGGHLQFENVMYRGEYLEGYAGETVSVRYDPRDITTIWIYRQEKQQEVFLTRAHAQGLETEQLSVDEAKASAKRLRDAGKTVSNQSILLETMEREVLVEGKKTRKQRHKEEQSYKQVQATPVVEVVEPIESEAEEATQTESEFAEIEVWDLDEMREDYGW
jgi:hypothetical protein